jgi:Uma2 family endonuclease
MATITAARATPEDLEAMPDGTARYELVNGEIRERTMSAESNYIANKFNAHVEFFVAPRGLGLVFTDGCGIQVFPEPNPLRISDGAFVAKGRLPGDRPPSQGYLRIAPDLVLEVVSPRDLAFDVDRKVADYLAVGVRLVWVAHPETRLVYAYAQAGGARVYGPDDDLDGGDVLPGFAVRVASLFPPPVAAPVEGAV